MSLATRLRAAFAVLLAALTAVVLVHVATMRRAVSGTRAVSVLAARHETVAAVQPQRLEALAASLRKYAVTRDSGYRERIAELARLHESELRALTLQSLSPEEEGAARELFDGWSSVSAAIDSLVVEGRLRVPPPARPAAATARRLADDVEALGGPAHRFAGITRTAMSRELLLAEERAAATARAFWIVAASALVLVAVMGALLVRSIVRPLRTLAHATREVARGQFGGRLDVSGRDEVAALTRDFNEMSTRLEQLDRMKRDFISNVSHDLKAPLTAMQETNDALLDGLAGPLGERQRHLLEMSRDSGRRLASMIHKLLDLSRIDARPTPVRELLDLSALVRRAVDHVNATRAIRGHGPEVVCERPLSHILLRADAEEIAQVLDNLLENAVKFSPAQGVVRVTLDDDGGSAVLRVADEGPGVPDHDKARVFARFHQGEAGRNAPDRGVGLGLAICRHVVEAHGGSIVVRDNVPRGAVFEVRVPGAMRLPTPPEAAPLVETLA